MEDASGTHVMHVHAHGFTCTIMVMSHFDFEAEQESGCKLLIVLSTQTLSSPLGMLCQNGMHISV